MKSIKNSFILFISLLILLTAFSPFKSSAFYLFPNNIDTQEERMNVQTVLNQVLVPSPNLVVDGKIGKKTIQAIQIFQALNGLVADGVPGTKTRAALESAQNITSTPGCAPGALFNTLTGQPCSSISTTNLPAGCLSTFGFSTLTGQSCSGTPTTNLPIGCTSTSGFSTVTGQSCGLTTPSVSGGGGGGGGARGGRRGGSRG